MVDAIDARKKVGLGPARTWHGLKSKRSLRSQWPIGRSFGMEMDGLF